MPRLLGRLPHRHPVVCRPDGNPPCGGHVKPLFLAAPEQITTIRVTPCGALANCRCFVAASPCDDTTSISFPDQRYAPCPDSAAPLVAIPPCGGTQCNRPATFAMLSLLAGCTTEGVALDLGRVNPAPFCLYTSIWRRSSYPCTTLAVLHHSLAARHRDANPDFATCPFCQ